MPNPMHYVTVTAPDGEVIGYAWGDATDVGWISRKASSPSAYEAALEWSSRVREAYERGLTSLDVLTMLSREPGVGPVTGAPDTAAVEELARTVTEADDRRLLAQLNVTNADAWRELSEAFAALTAEDRDVQWRNAGQQPDGTFLLGYPAYSRRLRRAVGLLATVGAVTPEHRWMDSPMPTVPENGRLRPADAVRAATAIVRGERFCDGTIAQAAETGLLEAVAESLLAWYTDRREK